MRLTLIMTVALLVFAACSGDEPADFDEPPAAVARSGAASVVLGLGSYCWSSGGAGICVDSFAIVTGTADLEVGRGESVTIGGALAQTQFAVEVAQIWLIEGEAERESDRGLVWSPWLGEWPGESSELEVEAVDGGLRFVAELPPGRYLVSLSLRFPQGSASYGLILAVR